MLALLLAGLGARSQASLWTLTDADSSVRVDDVLGRAYDWTVGGVNQLNQQWFYYRPATTGAEFGIESISAPTSVLTGSTVLNTTYANASISVQVKFSLIDSATPGTSGFNQDVTIINLSGASMNLSFFQYSDYNLGGDAFDNNVLMTKIGGKYGKAVQTDGSWRLTETVTGIGTTVNAEAALFNQTLASLTDGSTTTLNNVDNAGSGDLTYAFQWNKTLAAGATLQVSKLQLIEVVPEPSSMALGLLGAAALVGIRKRHL